MSVGQCVFTLSVDNVANRLLTFKGLDTLEREATLPKWI